MRAFAAAIGPVAPCRGGAGELHQRRTLLRTLKLYRVAAAAARWSLDRQDGMTERAKKRWLLAAEVALIGVIIAATLLTWLPAIVTRR